MTLSTFNRIIVHLGMTVLILLQSACKKEADGVRVNTIDLPENNQIRFIEELDDGFLVGGGKKGETGFVFLLDRNLIFQEAVTASLDGAVYDAVRWNNRWYFGSDKHRLYYSDSLRDLTEYFFQNADWVGDLYKQPIRRFAYTNDVLFAASGGKNSFGTILQTSDGMSWNPRSFDHEIRTVFCTEINEFKAWIGGNGILLRKNPEESEWDRIELNSSFISDIYFRDNDLGLLLEYDGDISRTQNGGDDWLPVERGGTGKFMNRLLYDFEGRFVAIGNKGQLAYSKDRGEEWKWIQLDDRTDLHDGIISGDRLILCGEGKLLVVTWPID